MRIRFTITLLILLLALLGCSKKEPMAGTDASGSNSANAPVQDQNAQSAPAEQPAPATETKPANQKATSKQLSKKMPAGTSSASAPAKAAAPAPITIPSGTDLTVRTVGALSSETSQPGETFEATLAEPIEIDGKVVAPKGADVTGKVVDAKKKGKFKGEARLHLALTSLTVGGKNYPIETTMVARTEKGKGKRTAATTGGGAALGALIGGLAGGGKGAAIGALVGGGAGLTGGALTGNKQIEIPAESMLSFQLNQSVTLK